MADSIYYPRNDAEYVRVVRCKDCKRLAKIMDEKSGAIKLECFRTWSSIKPDDFCSYGERVENESEQCPPVGEKDIWRIR